MSRHKFSRHEEKERQNGTIKFLGVEDMSYKILKISAESKI